MTFESDECLTWPFHIGRDGYGRAHDPIDGHLTTASRLICINAHGNPPGPNYECAHRCGKGNKGCVNPRHLYWATCATNHADKIEHGTTNRGERQGSHKLTEANIVAIRNSTESIATIAKRFDVTEGHIYDIRAGRRWEWFRT